MAILAVIAALILLGAFWRLALRGAIFVMIAGTIAGAGLLLVMVGILAWDRLIAHPKDNAAAMAEECDPRRHPDWPKHVKGGLTDEQFMNACPDEYVTDPK